MKDHYSSDRLVADLGQIHISEVYADACYTSHFTAPYHNESAGREEHVAEDDVENNEDSVRRYRVIDIVLEDVYRRIEREEGPDGERLRSGLARAIATANPVVANFKYLGCNVRIVKAVRHA